MSDLVVSVTNDTFEDEVVKASTLVMVDFWATWCGPCKAIAPLIDELAAEFAGKVKVGKGYSYMETIF